MTEGTAARRRFFKYRLAQQVPLTQSGEVVVNFVEVWEYNRAGQEVYHNSFVTDFAVTGANVAVVVGIGRSRWKIENEQFNVPNCCGCTRSLPLSVPHRLYCAGMKLASNQQ